MNDTLTAATQRRWRGVLPWLSHLLVGEQDEAQRAAEAAANEVKRLASHGAGFMSFARLISRPLMAIFSVGALIVFSRGAIADIYAAFSGHGTFNLVEGASVLVLYCLILGADVAMIVAAVRLYDALARGIWRAENWFDVVVLVGVGFLEAITLALMIASVEHPTSFQEWTLVIVRSSLAPIVAIYLALLYPRAPTDADYKRVLATRAGGRLLQRVESNQMSDDDLGKLYTVVALSTGISEQSQQDMTKLIVALDDLAPASIRREADALLAQKTAEWQTQMEKMRAAYQQQSALYTNEKAQLMDRLSSLETAVNEARMAAQTARDEAALQAELELGNTLQKVLLSLAYQQRLPDAIVEQYPDIAALNVESMFQQSAKHSRGNAPAKVAKETPDSAEGQRAFLNRILANVEAKGKLTGKPDGRNGVWITAPVLPVLSGGKVQLPAAQDIIKLLNKGDKTAKIGTSNAAPFVEVMRYLSGLGALGDEARTFWSSGQDTHEDDAA